jgi:hypothetical protein
MARANLERYAAAGGLISLVLFVVGWLVYGSGPTLTDDPATVLKFFTSHHDRVIWSMFAQGLGALALMGFMAALVMAMLDEGERVLAAVAAFSFAVALALGSAATIMRSGIAFVSVGEITPDTVAVLFYLGSVIDTGQNILSAGFFLAVGVAAFRCRFVPSWWGWLSLAAGLWAVASSIALDREGFWSPHGAGFLNLVLYIGWVAGTSVLLMRRLSGARPEQ